VAVPVAIGVGEKVGVGVGVAVPVAIGVGEKVGVGVGVAVPVAIGVGEKVGVGVCVGVGVIAEPAALKMMGFTHRARSPTGEPVAYTLRTNLTSCPTSAVRSISAA
jgi:hypothetical protein